MRDIIYHRIGGRNAAEVFTCTQTGIRIELYQRQTFSLVMHASGMYSEWLDRRGAILEIERCFLRLRALKAALSTTKQAKSP